eukprot:scaffold48864_cov63-Phaeocystis_antarctica.AAC.3
MTSPSVVSDWLMAMLSCRRSAPSPASFARSEPARSTSDAREVTTLPRPSSAGSVSEKEVADGAGDGGGSDGGAAPLTRAERVPRGG